MYASLHASLHRQAKALELLCQLLEEEYGILLSRRADDVAGLEFSIQELIRQLAVEKVTVITAMNGVRVTDYAAELCAAPGREAEGAALHDLVRAVDKAEQRASRQLTQQQLALALLDQSSRSLQALTVRLCPYRRIPTAVKAACGPGPSAGGVHFREALDHAQRSAQHRAYGPHGCAGLDFGHGQQHRQCRYRGLTRRYVDQRDGGTITTKPGGESLGVNAQQVLRYFDAFLESSYVRQSTNSARWSEQETIMSSVENLFNESNRTGISSTLTEFFTAWSDLAQRPDDTATRESLLSYADSLGDMLGSTVDSLKAIQSEMDVSINQGVDRVNALAQSIADLNKQINARTREGVSNPNDLLDQRDQMVRELAGLVDVQTTDNGGGDYTVRLSTGQPLVQGLDTFDLQVLGPRAEERLTANSSYAGSVQFDGTDSHEYTLEIVNGGAVGDTPPPSFRVSLDGGKTWLRDEDGNELRYTITDNDGDGQVDPVLVKELNISFSETSGFSAGDKFDIVPKTGLYWIEPTRGPQNITPQTYLDGTENGNRATGGTLTAYFSVRDDNCGRYLDELDAVASSLIWEVNRIHSQGTATACWTMPRGSSRCRAPPRPWVPPRPFCPMRTACSPATSTSIFMTRLPATT